MTSITVVYTDQTTDKRKTDKDYAFIIFWARNVVEHNDNIKQIIVDFDEGRMIFEAIN